MGRSKTPEEREAARRFGASLREAREAAGRTLRWTAEQAGVTYQQIQNYEAGRQLPNVFKGQLIASVFGADVEA